MAEFRRASNEFKMQMDEELRLSEQAERQKKIAEMEAAAPPAPALSSGAIDPEDMHTPMPDPPAETVAETTAPTAEPMERVDGVRPLPIATSGELNIMPPATGLPVAQTASQTNALDPLLDSIPSSEPEAVTHTEAAHGD